MRSAFFNTLAFCLCLVSLPGLATQSVQPEKRIDDQLHALLQNRFAGFSGSYIYNHVDLNHDAYPDAVVYMMSSSFCGSGGCDLLILQGTAKDYQIIGDFGIVRTPLFITQTAKKGRWETVFYHMSGGGLTKTQFMRLDFQNQRYDQCFNNSRWEDCQGRIVPETVVHGISYFQCDLEQDHYCRDYAHDFW